MKKVRLLLATLLLLAGNVLMAQTLKVTGTVTDATDGAPVIGAAVKVLGTKAGNKGRFSGIVFVIIKPDIIEPGDKHMG